MIELLDTTAEDLAAFPAMEQESDTVGYILPYSLARHRREFSHSEIIYRSIWRAGRLAGFIILALDPDPDSVEFRRIVIADKGEGLGQQAIAALEAFCRRELKRSRLWLDVFDTNRRAQHVYRKLGYQHFDSAELDGRIIHYYQKSIAPTEVSNHVSMA